MRNCHYNQSFKRNHSDGSENSDEYDEDYEDEENRDQMNSSSVDPNEDILIPRVLVRNKPIRFDRITPDLINQMNEPEKQKYIEVCQKLYTEIYEI